MKQLSSQRKGFTLIEMLVVIAIIALLASILVPAVTGALAKGERTKISQYARGIYLSVFGTITDGAMTRTANNFFPTTAAGHASSSAYFAFLMDEEQLAEDFEVFGAVEGMTYASTPAGLNATTNPWSVTQDSGINSPPSMPFIFTANNTASTLVDGSDPTGSTDITLDDTNVKYDDVLIFCNMGGAGGSLVGAAVIWENFNPTDRTNAILAP